MDANKAGPALAKAKPALPMQLFATAGNLLAWAASDRMCTAAGWLREQNLVLLTCWPALVLACLTLCLSHWASAL